MGGCVGGGWVSGLIGHITNSAHFRLGLGLSLAINIRKMCLGLKFKALFLDLRFALFWGHFEPFWALWHYFWGRGEVQKHFWGLCE